MWSYWIGRSMHSQGRLLLSNTAGIAGFKLHALFRHPEFALPILNTRAAVLPSPQGLQLSKWGSKNMFFWDVLGNCSVFLATSMFSSQLQAFLGNCADIVATARSDLAMAGSRRAVRESTWINMAWRWLEWVKMNSNAIKICRNGLLWIKME